MDSSRFKTVSASDFDDYEFILNDLARFAQMKRGELKAHYEQHPEDRLMFIRRPGGGSLFISCEGEERFWKVAERGCGIMGSDGQKHSLGEVVTGLKAELLTRFLADPSAITDENAHEIFEAVARSLESAYKDLEHFIPCSVVTAKLPIDFSVGPVRFLRMKSFLEQNSTGLNGDIPLELKSYLSDFNWVARMRIPLASKAVSTEKARYIVTSALNVIKLFLASEYAAHIRDGYASSEPHRYVNIVHDGAKFHVTSGWSIRDAPVADGWFDVLSNLDGWKIAARILSTHAASWELLPEAQQRFLDALAWYGDAVSDTDPRTQILKFWISIERIVSTDITRRSAMMASCKAADFESARKLCERLYGVRSAIVHGQRSRPKHTFRREAWQVRTLSATVLVHYLYLAHNLITTGNVSRADVEHELRTLADLAISSKGQTAANMHP